MIDAKNLLKLMFQREISDIHLKADSSPVLRLHGKLVPASGVNKLNAKDVKDLAYQLMTPEQTQLFETRNEMDLAYFVEGLSRFRVNIYRQRDTVALTLRLIPLKVHSFEDLHLPKEPMSQLANESRGLILFAGITGAGKTTTMNSMLQHINENRLCRIITVEDPIEYFHQDIKSSIVQREVGRDTESFAVALKQALRQDPDVLVIGEMRDYETVGAAIAAAETGHLVLSTIHTIDAAQTIGRIIDVYPAHQHNQIRMQLAGILKGIVAQRLVIGADGQGRFPATEILIGTGLVRRHIAEGKNQELYKAMESGSYYHMHAFDQDLIRLFAEHKIDQQTVLENATSPDDVALKIRGVSIETPNA